MGHHFFGTDNIGRDYFSRVVWGIRTSEEVGLVVAAVSSIVGLIVGAISGYYGGWLDNLLMRLTDLIFCFPPIILAMAIGLILPKMCIEYFYPGLAVEAHGKPRCLKIDEREALR